jgi:hypothetical protein
MAADHKHRRPLPITLGKFPKIRSPEQLKKMLLKKQKEQQKEQKGTSK